MKATLRTGRLGEEGEAWEAGGVQGKGAGLAGWWWAGPDPPPGAPSREQGGGHQRGAPFPVLQAPPEEGPRLPVSTVSPQLRP